MSETWSVAVAVPPVPAAGVMPDSVMVPGSDGLTSVIVSDVTVPSASVADTSPEALSPSRTVMGAGQVTVTPPAGTTVWLPRPSKVSWG